jgi:peptide/nickel transport system substrate-binding protein/glutathione transport system substrate-binding protein
MWFNTSKKPFDDPRVRRAVSFAIDREAISKAAFFGYGSPLYGTPTPPDTWYYNDDLSRTFSYNPEKAKQLLSEAGYPNGFKVKFNCLKGWPIYTTSAQIIQANLKDVGIDADLNLMEFATVSDNKNKGTYDFMMWGANVKMADPEAFSYYFGSESTYWAKGVGFHDQKIEDLLKKQRTTIDREQRKKIYHELEERVLELSPWVFINWRDQAQAYADYVKGYIQLGGALSENSPGIDMETLWLDK